jgi:hypothetical protein
VRVTLPSMTAVAFNLKQYNFDVLGCYLFKFNKNFFHFILLSPADWRGSSGSLITKWHQPAPIAYRAPHRLAIYPQMIRHTVRIVS